MNAMFDFRSTTNNGNPLSSGSGIFSNELVRTVDGGVARLVFLDNTDLAVGPQSEVRLDKFVYDPSGAPGSVIVQLSRGAFRFVTGASRLSQLQYQHPYATLGVRGTILRWLPHQNKSTLGQRRARGAHFFGSSHPTGRIRQFGNHTLDR